MSVDNIITEIADYVVGEQAFSELAYQTAQYCLLDSMGCALHAQEFLECTRHLGAVIEGIQVPKGCHVPGTNLVLDPIKAAFDTSMLIRWLDYNDTWLAKEWGHPSDNIGGILAACEYANQHLGHQYRMQDVLTAMIKCHEIQGILALDNSFNAVGLDHVVLVKVASAAVITKLLGGSHVQVQASVAQAFVDGQSLRTYRHAPNTGSRKSWAAADAVQRAFFLSLMTCRGEQIGETVLTAPRWGMEAVLMNGQSITLRQPLGCYVMENVLFKISYPAEFHAQTAVECALALHDFYKQHADSIKEITIETQKPAVDIIDKTGPLTNPADRDHCLQYMVAAALLNGDLNAQHYADDFALNTPELDILREKMRVQENTHFTEEYYELDKRAIGNAIQITLQNGEQSPLVSVDYPIGHRRRREEGFSALDVKIARYFNAHYGEAKAEQILALSQSKQLLEQPVERWMESLQN